MKLKYLFSVIAVCIFFLGCTDNPNKIGQEPYSDGAMNHDTTTVQAVDKDTFPNGSKPAPTAGPDVNKDTLRKK
jgi:hypothetical protein